jgi:hypothetical protein
MAAIYTKRLYYVHWLQRAFGARPRAWGTIEALERDMYSGTVTVPQQAGIFTLLLLQRSPARPTRHAFGAWHRPGKLHLQRIDA